MAKDVITRFKLETTQYDSALRNAAKGLSDYAKTASNAGKDFDKFTKDNIKAAKALGTMSVGATNAKDKVKELVGAYNEAAKAYESLSAEQKQADWAKAFAGSLTTLQQRIKDAKEELYGLGNAVEDVKSKSSGLFGGGGFTDMLAVAGGNLMSKGITMLASELTDAIGKSIELARQGEGVRLAFERLNQPGLLDQLKEATHGTVSEVELMKQAIKFENFKLPLEDLATYLAFAQQKAKDTGESIDYLVNSIVNGLGRQSKQILDNLGISAAELTKRMGEGATMTEAVADIIREEMQKAGDYVETAADRAARAAADATDEMERFGQQAAPIAEEWSQTWNALSIGAMSFANVLLGPVARSIRSIQNILNTSTDDRITGSKYNLFNGYQNEGPANRPTWGDVPVVKAQGGYVEVTDRNTGAVLGGQHFDNLQDSNAIKGWSKSLGKTGRSGGNKKGQTYMEGSLKAQEALVSELTKKWQGASGEVKDGYLAQLVAAESLLQKMKNDDSLAKWGAAYNMRKGNLDLEMSSGDRLSFWGADKSFNKWIKEKGNYTNFTGFSSKAQKAIDDQIKKSLKGQEKDKSFVEVADQINGGVSQMVSSLQQIGIDIPDGFKSVLGSLSGVIGLMQAIITVVEGAKAMSTVGSFLGSIFKLSTGGVIRAASGVNVVPGNTTGFDGVPALLQSGEVVLNRSQVNNLANMLEGGGMQNLRLEAVVTGEQIRFALNNNGRRTGRGEYVQTNRR